MSIDTGEPSQDIRPCHSDFLETSWSLPGRDQPPLQDMVGLESRLSTIVRLDAIGFFQEQPRKVHGQMAIIGPNDYVPAHDRQL